jgi:two-component system, chemotaxis family, protein-glutamate methylesterase/glutaminase
MIKILVVDDSALVRKLLGRLFEQQSDFEVAFAKDGVEALSLQKSFKPDVITLDVHMPGMDGLECLDRMMLERPCPVVMVSSMTEAAATATLQALRLGAVDAIAKPSGPVSLQMDVFGPQLVAKVRAAAKARLSSTHRLKERIQRRTAGVKRPDSARRASASASKTAIAAAAGEGLVLIGVSTGGPPALETVLSALPKAFAWPILIAQHMPASFTGPLARRLDKICAIGVRELSEVERLEPGIAYIGRGDADMVVEKRAGEVVGRSIPSEPEYLWHPSVDRLTLSALEHFEASQLIGVLMTGMGHDGAAAMALLRARGGRTIAEAEETAIVWGMPGELVRAKGAEWVLPVSKIGPYLLKLTP